MSVKVERFVVGIRFSVSVDAESTSDAMMKASEWIKKMSEGQSFLVLSSYDIERDFVDDTE
jgi:hypothetical protein